MVAPNGARHGRADHPAIPVSIAETVAVAHACQGAGARGLHLHVRDADGRHSLDAGHYSEALSELARAVPDLEVQITTEAAGRFDVAAQMRCVQQVQPKWASVSVREIALAPDMADRMYGLCDEQGTRVQHILYDAADAALLKRWQEAGIIRAGQVDRLLVLGRYTTGQVSTPADIDGFDPDPSPWMVCAFGPQEHACLQSAARQGADLRVGFENSLTRSDGRRWIDNAASVAALVSLLERTVA